jgi:hypothetical protein
MAVGYYKSAGLAQNLAAKWTGKSWSLVSTPNASTTAAVLSVLSCTSPRFCFALGSGSQTLTDRWNGTKWTASTATGSGTAPEGGTSCTSSTACTAVGGIYVPPADRTQIAVGTYNTGTVLQTRIEKWNGASWSKVASPDFGTNLSNSLASVSCTSASFCMAVGDYYSGSVNQRWPSAGMAPAGRR